MARWLVESGARVLVTDKDPPDKLADSLKALQDLPIDYCLGEHRPEHFTDVDLVVASPAVPVTNAFLQMARSKGVPVSTEIRLFIERCAATIIGVTGTKGKSTTSALLHRMLQTSRRTHLGGNIGQSLLSALPEIRPEDLVVLELSSYMLEHLRPMRWSPHVAVVTLLTADHLEWHGSLENYLDAKLNILRFQSPHDWAVIGPDGAHNGLFVTSAPGRVVHFPTEAPSFVLRLRGEHNQLNAQAAFAAARIFGVTFEQAQRAISDFGGLPHRLEVVHESHGVTWVNDSIATIPQAAVAALQAFAPRSVIQIVGGYDKHLPMVELTTALHRHAKAVLCIGQTGPSLAQALESKAGELIVRLCHDLPTAVSVARELACPGDTVLLSPGASSYDQFDNFEQRGLAFARLARKA